MPLPWGPILGAVGNVAGGLFGMAGANKGAKAAIKGAKINAKAAKWASRQNLKFQKLFAKKGIQWRANDARKAGFHPLAALGASGATFSPSFTTGSPGDGLINAGNQYAAAGASMGQGISRAATALGDIEDRNDEFTAQAQRLQLENLHLQNALLASKVATENQPGNPPPMSTNRWLIDGQGQTQKLAASSPLVADKALQRTASDPAQKWSEPGAVNDLGWTRTKTGLAPVMSTDAKERLEEDWIGGLTWNLRNRVLQNLQIGLTPPYPAPEGQVWKYNPLKQEYQLWDEKSLLRSHFKPAANTTAAEEAYRRRRHFYNNTGL